MKLKEKEDLINQKNEVLANEHNQMLNNYVANNTEAWNELVQLVNSIGGTIHISTNHINIGVEDLELAFHSYVPDQGTFLVRAERANRNYIHTAELEGLI